MRCINCMRETDGGACPHCGFDAAQYRPPDDALPPGSSLNEEKYVIGRVLGRGGFGITYVALDRNLGLRVAVKECMPQNAAWRDGGASVQWRAPVHEQESMMENFVREARKMAQIYGISGVVPVREYFYDNETAYIVMDYVEGETLMERLRRTGALSAKECFRLLSPVMDSLAQAHKRGLVHRDIKPNNIMIGRIMDGDERVWLLDLGAAKDLGTRLSAPNVSAESRIIGTPGYTPLEQCSPDGRIGPWTDVYAMSATFFYCMTGKKPPNSQSRALEERPPEVLMSVQGPVGDVLRKGMALRPGERYQTMEELRDALEKAVNDIADTQDYDDKTEVSSGTRPLIREPIPKSAKVKKEPPKTKPETPVKTPERRKLWVPIVIAALCLALIPLALNMTRSQSATAPKTGDNESLDSATAGADALPESATASADALPESETVTADPSAEPEIVASGECGENASWTLDSNGLLTISGTGPMEDYEYGEGYDSSTPRGFIERKDFLSPPWKKQWGAISNVLIYEGITYIGNNAFAFCKNLKSIKIPDSVTTIGHDAFDSCDALTNVTIPDNVTEINHSAFMYCSSLSSVEISDSVTVIRSGTFMCCSSLSSVEIPDSVKTIERVAFGGCTNLSSVSVPADATIADDAFDETTTVIRR